MDEIIGRMRPSTLSRFRLPIVRSLLLTGIISLPAATWAQGIPDAPAGTGGIATGRRQASQPKPAVVPPPAVPGARSSLGAAPITRLPSDMQPSEALFDAINRGDIAGVRDAFSRGAELNAQNVLGLTPTELAVDLGRNDIALLLLSMRGEEARGSRRSGSVAPEKALSNAKPAPVATKAVAAARRGPAIGMQPVTKPRLFANDGGTPNPSAGFLGFDTGHNQR
jgi:hypothetical protein